MSNAPQRFLLTMWEGGGTVPPELGVARRLIARGHHVHVLADPTIGPEAGSIGCTFSPWRRAPHRTSLDPSQDILKDWETSNPLVMLKRVRDRFLAGPAADFAADTAEEIAAFGPDALITDYLLFGAVMAAQAAHVPVAALVPNIWMLPTRGTPSIGPGFPPAKTALGRGRDAAMLAVTNRLFKKGLPTLNAARAAHGLAPLSSFYDQALTADRILVLTSPAFDFAAPFVPSNVRYVGPILDDPAWAEPWTNPWEDRRDPLVLVALSSTYQNQGPLLQRVVERAVGTSRSRHRDHGADARRWRGVPDGQRPGRSFGPARPDPRAGGTRDHPLRARHHDEDTRRGCPDGVCPDGP